MLHRTITVPTTLVGCEAKLIRAQELMHDLDDQIFSYLSSRPFETHLSYDRSMGAFRYLVGLAYPPPLKISLLVGEIVHDLRCAVEYLGYELARRDAGREIHNMQFPIFWDAGDYRDYRRNKRNPLRHLTRRHRAFLGQIQPYRWRDRACLHPLATLTRLSNQDKHRVLHTVGSALRGSGFAFRADKDIAAILDIRYATGVIDKEIVETMRVYVETDGPDPRMTVEGEMTFDVAFDEGVSVLESLEDVRVYVGDLVDWLSPELA